MLTELRQLESRLSRRRREAESRVRSLSETLGTGTEAPGGEAPGAGMTPKQLLNETAQKLRWQAKPSYQAVETDGSTWRARVTLVDGAPSRHGEDQPPPGPRSFLGDEKMSKRRAEHSAALAALQYLEAEALGGGHTGAAAPGDLDE